MLGASFAGVFSAGSDVQEGRQKGTALLRVAAWVLGLAAAATTIALLAACTASAVLMSRLEKRPGVKAARAGVVLFPLSLLLAAGSVGVAVGVALDQGRDIDESHAAWTEGWTQSIEDHYGIKLNSAQLRTLAIPSEAPTDPEVFGTTELTALDGRELTTTSVRLIWDGEEYALLSNSVDGSWSELSAR